MSEKRLLCCTASLTCKLISLFEIIRSMYVVVPTMRQFPRIFNVTDTVYVSAADEDPVTEFEVWEWWTFFIYANCIFFMAIILMTGAFERNFKLVAAWPYWGIVEIGFEIGKEAVAIFVLNRINYFSISETIIIVLLLHLFCWVVVIHKRELQMTSSGNPKLASSIGNEIDDQFL